MVALVARERRVMSIKNGVWHDGITDPPGAEHINKSVLAIRVILSSGKAHYRYDFAIYNAHVMKAPSCTWDGKWNKKNVIYWMPLPDAPSDISDIN